MFVYEGNGVILNLRAEAKNPKAYPRLLSLAVLVLVIIYMILGTMGYLCYRTDIDTYINMQLPINAFSIIITALLCVNAFSSYPVQILCTFEIIEELSFFKNDHDSRTVKNIKMYSERIIIIILVTVVSSLIPNFLDFLNLAGSLGSSVLAFILPPIYYL
jgi:amino acid permease